MKIDHIAIYVRDLEGARDFFKTFFNATSNEMYHNITTGLKTYFLTFDNGTRLEIMEHPEMEYSEFKKFRQGYAHIAFSVGSKEKVDSLTNELNEHGYRVISGPRITGDGFYESCIQGFEDNLIEITVGKPQISSYFKIFCSFLLIVAIVTVAIVFLKNYLRLIGIVSIMSRIILLIVSIPGYFFAWKWLSQNLKKIEGR
ncbi:MAG: VOC family protein [Muribaculaceae bacterium]|nr:VOC family protein [Muribaculaceae bacterium]